MQGAQVSDEENSSPWSRTKPVGLVFTKVQMTRSLSLSETNHRGSLVEFFPRGFLGVLKVASSYCLGTLHPKRSRTL